MKFTIFCFQYFFLEFYSYICVDVEFSEHYDTMLQLKEKKEWMGAWVLLNIKWKQKSIQHWQILNNVIINKTKAISPRHSLS
jgi:hypothetical protein